MQGELIIIAVGLVVALAFSTLIKSFTDSIITPLVNAAEGEGPDQRVLGGRSMDNALTSVRHWRRCVFHHLYGGDLFRLVVPYRAYMKRRGTTVFGPPAETKTCPQCLSDDLPLAALKCSHCASAVSTTS